MGDESNEYLIEERVIYEDGSLRIHVMMFEDSDAKPDEYDCYSPEDLAVWANEEWRFVGLVATVQFQGVPIGESSLWSIEHGSLAEVEADAWEWQPSTVDGDRIVMGSALYAVAAEAVDDAWHFMRRLTGNGPSNDNAPLIRVLRTVAEIRPDEIEAAHEAALVENNARPARPAYGVVVFGPESCGDGDIIPGVAAPMNSHEGIQLCQVCGLYDNDEDAARALAAVLVPGGIVQQLNYPPFDHCIVADGAVVDLEKLRNRVVRS